MILAAAAFTGGSEQSHADLGLPREAYGVWDRAGGHPVDQFPYVRGQEYAAEWTAINPARNTFDWTALDSLLQLAYDQNQRFFVKIQPVAATTMPSWIFTAGVPKITCPTYTYGYYLDPEFKIYFAEMVQALGKHLREDLPAHLANIVTFVRADTGATGDEEPYEGSDLPFVPAEYQISAEEWRNYRLWAFDVYDQAFQQGTGPHIPLLFQNIEVPAYQTELDWVMTNVTSGFGAKYGGQVRGHHLSESRNVPDSFKALSVDTPLRFFSVNEMDQTWEKPYFQLNLKLGMYWCAVEQLNAGMTIWDWSSSVMEGAAANDIVSTAEFFNTWAAELDPPTARGGFCIFHEGLASEDTTKFPIATYGSATKANTDRYTAICAAYASQGAKMDDLARATLGQVAQRRLQTGFNDSGWEIWPGNYERFITQMNPDSTSKGVWRVNGTLTTSSHPYDRFARRFDSATGRNTMYFEINDNLLPSVGQRVRLSVDYLDRGTGQFALRYDAVGNNQKTAFTVTKTNSNTWKTASVVVKDWAFGNQGPNSSDLTLVNLDSDDDIFHKLEVSKLAHVQIGTVGMGTVSARTDATTYSPVVGDDFVESQRLELTVTPASGWKFTGWSGALTGTSTRPFLFPTKDSRVTATFARTSATPPSSVPIFSSDPIGKTAAPLNGVYSGTLSGDASDPNGQALTFSKVSGPSWLSITADGTLSGTPQLADLGLNRWAVQVSSSGGTDTAILLIDVIAPGPNPPAGLSYSRPPVYTKGTVINNLSPSSIGGGVVRYVATPNLPNGLRLNSTTGLISGTPLAPTPAATYTITATNPDGSTTTSLNITVIDIAPSALTYSSNPASYQIDQAITLNAPTNGGGAVVSYAVSPALPAGLALNTTTGMISGTPTALSTSANYTITATNTGGSTTAQLNIAVEEGGYRNSALITINDNAAASPYPSAIVVPATAGTITRVTVTIYGLTHARQNDLDILLVGPSGQKVLLMSDVGGGVSVANVNLTFDDAAAVFLPTGAVAITTGTYRPTDSGGNSDTFSAPAPAAPYDLTLAVFKGTNPAGTWSLYVMDDRASNTGSISGGWKLYLETTAPPVAAPSALSYSSNPATYARDVAISDNTPASSGGAVVSYAVSPALPAGLTLNTSTGVISGRPTTLTAAANYIVTATNTGGSTTASVSIAVNDVAPSSLSYSSSPATYAKDTVIQDNRPTSSGGAVVWYAVAPALPTGLTLNTSTGVISGTPTTFATAADYTVTATNTGGSTTASISIMVNDVAPSSLSYSSNPATYAKDVAIPDNAPTSSGGAVVWYAVSPALPTGLTLNTSTGVISGTPTTLATAADYTVTAANTGGSTTASVSITVNDIAPSSLSYSSNPATYTKDATIPDNTPTSSGGAVVSYAVSPALPTGLTLNTSTGIISGTPATLATAADYTVTATNTGGSTTASVSIAVNDVAPFSLSYASNPATYTKDATIPDNTPTSSGGAVVSYAVSPALPAGLTFNTSTGVISGTPTTLATAADYTVTASNTGGSTTAAVSIAVNDVAPSSLSYYSNPTSYTKDTIIPDNTPTSSGGAAVSYAVSPALPAGLTLNTSTGVISGTPTTLATAANYTVTASNTGGSTTTLVSITIRDVEPSALTYASNPTTYTKDTAIPDNTPTSSGGAVVSYAVSPALPAGLTLNTSTGVISGTPTTLATAADYTVTASNTGGSTTASVSIKVNDVAPSSLSYSNNLASYTKDMLIPDNTPTSSGGAVVFYAVSPALPTGLTLNTSTGVISGTPSAVTTTASYTVTATNTGGFSTASVSIMVNDVGPSSLSYPSNPATYTKDAAIPNNAPTSSGGAVVSYAVSPALPAGLTLNTSTGVISGTPTTLATAADYTVTASNTGGSTTALVSIAVNDVAPSSLSYSSNPATYTKDAAIPDNTPTCSGGAVTSYMVLPTLPEGLTLNTSTGVISGTPTTLATAADYTVTATNTGGSTTASVSIMVNDVAPSSLSYSSNPATYAKETLIPDNTPTSSGGAVTSYMVLPTLPEGLTLNTSTGVISGTPTTLATSADYTVTASNTGGSTTAAVSIMVNDVAPSSLSYSSNPTSYTKDTVIPDNMPTSSGGAVVSYAVSPALPTGLTLNTSTGVISGTPTTLATAADYTVTAANTGGSTTAALNLAVISVYSAWSTQYQLTQGPEGDDDGDSYSNYFEFVADLIPNNAASVFKTTVTHVPGQANQMAIVYGPIADGRTYELKSSDSLAPGSWTVLRGSISSDLDNERKVIDTEATGPKKYYRVEINYP